MFNDPEIDKLIIFALLGMVAILGIAVIVLAVKKNTYYVDEDGNEITSNTKKTRRIPETQEEEDNYIEPITLKAAEKPLNEPAEPSFQNQLEEAMSVKPASPKGLTVTVIINGQAQRVVLHAFPALIGRDSNSCQLPVVEPAVSRRHARFTLENGYIYIEDVSEHNGTYINGTKLPPLGRSKVSEGDKINLGRAEIIVDKIVY